mgnify:CR=1 FL=1
MRGVAVRARVLLFADLPRDDPLFADLPRDDPPRARRRWSASAISAGISDGMRATATPAASNAAIFSAAVPLPPEMIAPGVSHALARRRGLTGDERDDRLA